MANGTLKSKRKETGGFRQESEEASMKCMIDARIQL